MPFNQSMNPGDPGHAATHRDIGERLNELSDANLSATYVAVEGAPADGDAIVWDESAEQWVPAAVAGGSSLTVLSEAEGDAGVATTARAISAARLKQQIEQHAPAGGGTIAAIIVETGAEARLTADVVVWIDLDELGTPNALATDIIVTPATNVVALVDAKGDLIVGTAADSLARLGVGSNGHVLTADSGEIAGVKWAAPAGGGGGGDVGPLPVTVNPPAGSWIASPGSRAADGSSSTVLNRLYLSPFYGRGPISIDQVGIKTWVDADTGGHIRIGLWASDSNGKPTGTPVAVCDIVTDDGADVKYATFSVVADMDAGLWFAGAVQQTAHAAMAIWDYGNGTVPLQAFHGGYQLNHDPGDPMLTTGYWRPDTYYVDGVSGALGDLTAATFVPLGGVPRMVLKVDS